MITSFEHDNCKVASIWNVVRVNAKICKSSYMEYKIPYRVRNFLFCKRIETLYIILKYAIL